MQVSRSIRTGHCERSTLTVFSSRSFSTFLREVGSRFCTTCQPRIKQKESLLTYVFLFVYRHSFVIARVQTRPLPVHTSTYFGIDTAIGTRARHMSSRSIEPFFLVVHLGNICNYNETDKNRMLAWLRGSYCVRMNIRVIFNLPS